MTLNTLLPIGALAALAAQSLAGAPGYTFQIQARTNFASNPGGSFNVPGNWFFSGEDIQLNDARQVSFHLSVTSGDFQSVWFGANGTGSVVYNSGTGGFLSQTSLNNVGRVIWAETFVAVPGIYRYDSGDNSSAFFTNKPLGSTGWSTPRINNSGLAGYRVQFGFSGQAFVSFDPVTNTTAIHAAETGVDPLSPYSFLFTPSFNNARQIAGKVRYGPGTGNERPDEIRIFNADGSSILIARDRDADPASPYTAFDNSVSLNNFGFVAFCANLFGGGRAVFASDGTTTLTIASTVGTGAQISDLEFFAPSINDNLQVVFRAKDLSGLRAIWVGDGSDLRRVVTEHDILPSDLGDARVDQNDASPVFGGAPSINQNGDVAFNAALTPPDNNQIEWGTGVFVAIADVPPACPGDADGDGDSDSTDLNIILTAFGCTPVPPAASGEAGNGDGDGCPGDLDADGDTDSTDLNILLTDFGCSG